MKTALLMVLVTVSAFASAQGKLLDELANNLLGNAVAAAGSTVVAADGPSSMRDALLVTEGGAWNVAAGTVGFYLPALGRAIVGASNVSWWYGARAKISTVGNSTRLGLAFTGDAGGAEYFDVYNGVAPADWGVIGGTVGPIRAAQTAVYCEGGSTNLGDKCQFAEPYLIKNRATGVLAHRRVGIAASASTATPVLSYTNVANARYSPASGRLRVRVAGFAGAIGAATPTFLGFGAAGANGALVLDFSGGALRLRIYNDVGALVGTATCGAVSAASHEYVVEWDAVLGKAAVFEGATVLGSFAAVWTPAAAGPNPIYVGSDAAGANAARCFVSLLNVYDF